MPMHELDDAQERYELRELLEIAHRLTARPKTEVGRWVGEAVHALYAAAETDRQTGTTVRTSTLVRRLKRTLPRVLEDAGGWLDRGRALAAAAAPARRPRVATPARRPTALQRRLAYLLVTRGPLQLGQIAAALGLAPASVCRPLTRHPDWFRKGAGFRGRWEALPAAKEFLTAAPSPAEPAREPACA